MSFRFLPRYMMLVAVLCVVCFSTYQAQAAPGDLDTTFDGDGIVTTAIGSAADRAFAIAIQPDGKIVVAGTSRNGTRDEIAVARYHPDGTLDTSFDGDGKVTTPINASGSTGRAVVIQPDGKIVVGGSSGSGFDVYFAVVRYNADGSLDTSFDGDGIVITIATLSPPGFRISSVTDLAIQPDGKIVAAGYTYNNVVNGGNNNFYDFCIVRYNPNGSLDNSFNSVGFAFTPIGSGDDVANGVVIQPNGKIVAAGYSNNGSNNDFALVRYNTNGSPDTSFDGDGKVTTPVGSGSDIGYDLLLQPDSKLVVAGYATVGGPVRNFALARYNPNGSLDTSFNSTGIVTTAIGSDDDEARDVALQPGNKIVAAGVSNNGLNFDFAVVRYNPNGSLDTSFNGTGKVTTPVGSLDDQADGVAIQPDGKIVAAGYSNNGSNNDFALARYEAFTPLNRTSVFDADALSDIGIWNPNNHHWYINHSSDGTQRVVLDWGDGALGDKAVPRDYDGDGRTDIAVWRPSEANWYIIKSSDNNILLLNWGGVGDIPVPADYDGDGKADVAVFRPSEGNWYIKNSGDQSVTLRGWGASNDKPVAADYDGDGRADVAVYRPSEGNWYIITSGDGLGRMINWGTAADKPVQADYDGDGRADVAVWRPTEGTWYIRYWTNVGIAKSWGNATDTPVPADYDGDRRADIAVFRPAEGTWYIIRSATNSVSIAYLGGSGDVPTPATYLPQ